MASCSAPRRSRAPARSAFRRTTGERGGTARRASGSASTRRRRKPLMRWPSGCARVRSPSRGRRRITGAGARWWSQNPTVSASRSTRRRRVDARARSSPRAHTELPMSYVDRLLAPGETVLHRALRHWVVLMRWIGSAVVLAVLGIAMASIYGFAGWQGSSIGAWIGVGLLAIAVLVALPAIMRWVTEVYLVTDRRVIRVAGVLHK